MEDLQSNEILNNISETDNNLKIDTDENISTNQISSDSPVIETDSTAIIEYKEVEEPCVALTIIGENRLTDAEIFVKRSFRFSNKAFFSTLVLTIMNMFI